MLRFLKNRALPVAIGTGAGAYLLFSLTPALAGAAETLGPWCGRALPASLFLTLFATFSKVDFRQLRPRAWHGALLLVQLAATGGLAWAASRLPAGGTGWWSRPVAEAALVCVIAPCATATPVVTAKLGGDLTQATAFTLLSSMAASLAIPAVFPALEPGTGMTFGSTSAAILGKLAPVLLLPLALGAWVRHGGGRLRRWMDARPDLGFHCWCVSLALTSGITVRNLLRSEAGAATLAAVAAASLATAALQFAVGRRVGRAFGVPVCAGQGLFQKNTGLAIWISHAHLSPVASVGAGFYVLWQNFINAWELGKTGRTRE